MDQTWLKVIHLLLLNLAYAYNRVGMCLDYIPLSRGCLQSPFFPQPHPQPHSHIPATRLPIPKKLSRNCPDQHPSSSRDAQMLIEDVKRIVHELDQGQQLSSIGVELVDNELAILYMNSKKSEVILDFHP